MKLNLPQYNGKDNLVMILVSVPMAIIINSIYFGQKYFSSAAFFFSATAISAVEFMINFVACGLIAVIFRKRLSAEHQLMRRLVLMIIIFLSISILLLFWLFRVYEMISFFDAPFNENQFAWTAVMLAIMNIFTTFLMEGIAKFKEWKQTSVESDKLSAAYKQSQLSALKSQVSPHFLFNSLNSLSSLIQEDEEKAELFLDELSKVYRYMLRNDDEQLVPLSTELDFLDSYSHLLHARFGVGLQIVSEINEADKDKLIAPLLLQVIIENAFTQNIVRKTNPLAIKISSGGNALYITNNLQPRASTADTDAEAGLDNLIKKYRLLGSNLLVNEAAGFRTIQIPLIQKERR